MYNKLPQTISTINRINGKSRLIIVKTIFTKKGILLWTPLKTIFCLIIFLKQQKRQHNQKQVAYKKWYQQQKPCSGLSLE